MNVNAKGADYVYQNYNFTFEDGEEYKVLPIGIIDDNVVEPDETYSLIIGTIKTAATTTCVIPGEIGATTIKIVDDDGKYKTIQCVDTNFTLIPVKHDINVLLFCMYFSCTGAITYFWMG